MKFGFVAKHRGIWPVALMCGTLGVSRGGFYAWLDRPRSQRELDDEVLGKHIKQSFVDSDRTYGARRVWHDVLSCTLRYLRNPKQRHVHRSQNRIESYHQLRSAIAQVGGKKELTGRTDLEIEISNQCGRLIANAIVFYNSAILSRLLVKCQASGSEKALVLVTSTSPVAWRNVHLGGRYAFRDSGQAIDLDVIVLGLKLE